MNEPEKPLIAGELLRTSTPLRIHLTNLLAFVGLLIAAAAQADLKPVLDLLPSASRETLTGFGLAVVALKPFLNLIYDLLDDGKVNKSQVLLPLVVGFLCVFVCSCGLSVTPDGCLTGSYTKDGRTYAVGPCFGENGKVNRWRAKWTNDTGIAIRSTYYVSTKRVSVEYQTEGGGWIGWDSKSGVLLDGNPLVVQIVAEQKKTATDESRRTNLPDPVRAEDAGVPAGRT